MHRLSVRHDYVLERQFEQRPQRRKRPLLVPGRRPDAELPRRRGQRVGEDKSPLLGQPERCLVAAPAVVQRDEATRKLTARFDRMSDRRSLPC